MRNLDQVLDNGEKYLRKQGDSHHRDRVDNNIENYEKTILISDPLKDKTNAEWILILLVIIPRQ